MESPGTVKSDMDRSHIETESGGDQFYSCIDEYGLKLYRCSTCQITYIEKYAMKRHIKCHTKQIEKQFCCTSCEQKFRTKKQLSSHKEIVHENIKNYSCFVCEKQFYSRNHLRSHLTVHDDARNTEKRWLPGDWGWN